MAGWRDLLPTAEELLAGLGVGPGTTALDFGCGGGVYACALARLAGPAGAVYALDRDATARRRLRGRRHALGLANLHVLAENGDATLPPDGVDRILLFDMLHEHYFDREGRAALYARLRPRLRPAGRWLIFPNHIEPAEIPDAVDEPLAALGFARVAERTAPLVHDEAPSEGTVLVFAAAGPGDGTGDDPG